MDNFGLHKVEKSTPSHQKDRAEPLDLPPDSPDLNLIEKAWAKLKQLLRATKAQFKGELNQAIIMLSNSSPPEVKAWSDYLSSRLQLQSNA